MNPNRARFQAELAEAMIDWNHRTKAMAEKARNLQGQSGTRLGEQVAHLEAQRARLVSVIDALRADESGAEFSRNTEKVAKAVEAFEKTYHQLRMSADSLYESNVMDLMRARGQKESD